MSFPVLLTSSSEIMPTLDANYEYDTFSRGLDKKKLTPLFNKAISNGQFSFVKWCVEHDVAPDSDFYDSVSQAVINEHTDVVKYLLQRIPDDLAMCDIILTTAAMEGLLEIVKAAVDTSSDLDTEEALQDAIKNGHTDVTEFLLHDDVGEKLLNKYLIMAIECNQMAVIDLLSKKGANLEQMVEFVISFALLYDDVSLVEYILTKFPDSEIDKELFVMSAVELNNESIVRFFLSKYQFDKSFLTDLLSINNITHPIKMCILEH